jgi:hypothetical protein
VQPVIEPRVPFRRHVDEVRAPLFDRTNAVFVEVDARHVEAGLREGHGQRKARVAEADGAEAGFARRDAVVERCRGENLRHGFGW